MKTHIYYSPDAMGNSETTEPVKRLANRYNIPEKDVEALLYGSRAPKGVALGSHNKGKSMADEFRSNYNAPAPQSGWSPVNVLSAIVGVLGILALAIILIHVLQRNKFNHTEGGMMSTPPSTTASNPPHPAIQDTTAAKSTSVNEKPDGVPSPATTNEIDTKPAPKLKQRALRHSSTFSSSSSGFSTSNNLEAQERLAEMRADGNTKARIRGRSKNGVTIYSVR